MAAALLAAAAAPSYPFLLIALALYGPASGLGTQLAQGALAAMAGEHREGVLARWELLSLAGDLLAPGVLAASVALGLGWRGALLGAALLAAAQAVAVARAPVRREEDPADPGDEVSVRSALRLARSSPALLGWSFATALCGLMDEVFVSFGALWLAGQGLEATARAGVLSSWVVGGMAGAVVLERISSRLRPSTLLVATGAGSAAAFLLWLAARGAAASAATAAIMGFFTSSHYPLLRARAFAALPGRPEVVVAVGSAFTALDLVAPVLIGAVADGQGLLPALLLLLVQPAATLTAGLVSRSPPRQPGR